MKKRVQILAVVAAFCSSSLFGSFKVFERTLSNGLNVIVVPVHRVPEVHTFLCYHVGARYEQGDERGLAHYLEHVIFKGTNGPLSLSETDIPAVANKCLGSCNAFTCYDFTTYYFGFSRENWTHALTLYAECMEHCTFKTDLVDTELKAVVQEIKMNRDNYKRHVPQSLFASVFGGHGYGRPIIGYRSDLYNVTHDTLMAFYSKYYHPGNASLIVVGDVDPEEAFEQARGILGGVQKQGALPPTSPALESSLRTISLAFRYPVSQPHAWFMFTIPGLKKLPCQVLSCVTKILAGDKQSRLYKRLVDVEGLATSVSAGSYGASLYDALLVGCTFVDEQARLKGVKVIKQELEHLARDGFSDQEIERACANYEVSLCALSDNLFELGLHITSYYNATKNHAGIFSTMDATRLKPLADDFARKYLYPGCMHEGCAIPLEAGDEQRVQEYRLREDEEDHKLLYSRSRESEVEPLSYATRISVNEPQPFSYAYPEQDYLHNGIRLFFHRDTTVPMVDVILSLESDSRYDSADKIGISRLVSLVVAEGTKKYPGQSLQDTLDAHAMSLSVTPGNIHIQVRKQDIELAFDILSELAMHAQLSERAFITSKKKLIASVRNYWDTPNMFIAGEMAKLLYPADHPGRQVAQQEDIEKLTHSDVSSWYKKAFVADKSRLSVVGDADHEHVFTLAKQYLSDWNQGNAMSLSVPSELRAQRSQKRVPFNAEQTLLSFCGLSVKRDNKDYLPLLIVDEILGGLTKARLSSRLFSLREETGLFYTFRCAIAQGNEKYPGMVHVLIGVANSKAQEAYNRMRKFIQDFPNSITQQEVDQAKNIIVAECVSRYRSNAACANTFLHLDTLSLGVDYYRHLPQLLEPLTVDDVQRVAREYLDIDRLSFVAVGNGNIQ